MDSDDEPSSIAVTVSADRWRTVLHDPEGICRRAILATLGRAAPADWRGRVEVSVLLCDDAKIQELNARYRGRDGPTNVLSFPGRAPGEPEPVGMDALLLGDIVIALETACAEAAADGKPLAAHVSHLAVHGCLHLLGHEHDDDAAAAKMEALERMILMQDLGLPDPYAAVAELSDSLA